MVRVKICGLTRPADAELAIEQGADALGFILEPSSPRFVRPADLAWIAALAPWPVRVAVYGPFLAKEGIPPGLDGVQSLDEVPSGIARFRLRTLALPPAGFDSDGAQFWVENVRQLALEADAILLDAHRAGSFGGTGLRVDPDLARSIVLACPLPVILAGGLNPNNVAEAIRLVQPWGVDVSSGVESSPGLKDPSAIRDFIAAVRG